MIKHNKKITLFKKIMTQKKSSHKLETIPIKQVDPSPFQKRKYFDDSKLKELALSIKTDGLIEPVIVRQKGERYEKPDLIFIDPPYFKKKG